MNTISVKNYILSHNDEDMFIYVPSLKEQFYTDYNKGLYDIFQSGIFSGATYGGTKKNYYLRFVYDKHGARVYFSHIVFCYYYRGLTKDNYVEVIHRFKDELKDYGLQVDHLIEDKHNNTRANLSLISGSNNRRKRSMLMHIKNVLTT